MRCSSAASGAWTHQPTPYQQPNSCQQQIPLWCMPVVPFCGAPPSCSGCADVVAPLHAGCAAPPEGAGMGTWDSQRKVLVKSAPVSCITCAARHRR
jgi:hypothetical protein